MLKSPRSTISADISRALRKKDLKLSNHEAWDEGGRYTAEATKGFEEGRLTERERDSERARSRQGSGEQGTEECTKASSPPP